MQFDDEEEEEAQQNATAAKEAREDLLVVAVAAVVDRGRFEARRVDAEAVVMVVFGYGLDRTDGKGFGRSLWRQRAATESK